jgi:carboxyl-terminal processing protease
VQPEPVDRRGRKPKLKQIVQSGLKILGIVVVVVVIFTTGVGVGNGSIQFGSYKNIQNKDLPADLDYSEIESLYDTLKSSYDGELTVEKLLDGMKSGLAEASGDPYTVYLNAQDAEEFNRQLSGTFSGIGAELGQDADKNLIIVAPIGDFPASKAGLRPQDMIVEIDGKSTAGLNVPEAVTKIRGPKGTKVSLRILRNKSEYLKFTITRQDIKVPSIKYEILDGGVGYLQITQFNDDTTELATKAAQEFKNKGVKGVVVDLRGNPGGRLTASVEVTSLWLPQGETVLQERRGSVIVSTEEATGDNLLEGMPTAVLINEGSASASEIMAGALKDHKAATLFGAKSFGKGSVQHIKDLAGGAELKVTIARWYRPNGENIDKKGITPDKTIKMTNEDYENDRDPQKDAAIKFIKDL